MQARLYGDCVVGAKWSEHLVTTTTVLQTSVSEKGGCPSEPITTPGHAGVTVGAGEQ